MTDKEVRFTEKKVDESWKENVAQDQSKQHNAGQSHDQHEAAPSHSTFSTLVTTLAMQVLMQLGELPQPSGEKGEMNLDAAREVIDILAMLKEKTRGNLKPDEERLITGILSDLQLKFVNMSNQSNP